MIVAAAGVGPGETQASTPDANPPAVFWDASPEALVVSYRDVWGALANPDPTPLIRIFGDGRVVVHHPDYTPRAGEYELTLGSVELTRLLSSLAARGLTSFAPDEVGRLKVAEDRRRWQAALAADKSPELFMVADDSTSVFELHLTGYRPPGAALTVGEIHRVTSWLGLGTDAERYPAIAAIQQLRSAELELRALLDRNELRKVR